MISSGTARKHSMIRRDLPMRSWRIPVPRRKASAHARVYDDAGPARISRSRQGPSRLLLDGKHQRPELVLRRSIPGLTHSPINASLAASRPHAHELGAGVARYAFTVTDLHRLPSAGLPAHPSTASKGDTQPTARSTLDSAPAANAATRLREIPQPAQWPKR